MRPWRGGQAGTNASNAVCRRWGLISGVLEVPAPAVGAQQQVLQVQWDAALEFGATLQPVPHGLYRRWQEQQPFASLQPEMCILTSKGSLCRASTLSWSRTAVSHMLFCNGRHKAFKFRANELRPSVLSHLYITLNTSASDQHLSLIQHRANKHATAAPPFAPNTKQRHGHAQLLHPAGS